MNLSQKAIKKSPALPYKCICMHNSDMHIVSGWGLASSTFTSKEIELDFHHRDTILMQQLKRRRRNLNENFKIVDGRLVNSTLCGQFATICHGTKFIRPLKIGVLKLVHHPPNIHQSLDSGGVKQ